MDSNLTQQRGKLSGLAKIANREHKQFERLAGEALDHAHRAGAALIEAKASLPHGSFETWLSSNVTFSARTARSYMRVSANWPAITAKRSECPSLSLRDAIGLLVTPKVEQSENGNALPFCLPSPGQMLFGRIGNDGEDFIVIEAYPFDDAFVRIAVLTGSEFEFTRRGISRTETGRLLAMMNVDAGSIEWFTPRPATATNNPLGHAIPEWKYGEVSHA